MRRLVAAIASAQRKPIILPRDPGLNLGGGTLAAESCIIRMWWEDPGIFPGSIIHDFGIY